MTDALSNGHRHRVRTERQRAADRERQRRKRERDRDEKAELRALVARALGPRRDMPRDEEGVTCDSPRVTLPAPPPHGIPDWLAQRHTGAAERRSWSRLMFLCLPLFTLGLTAGGIGLYVNAIFQFRFGGDTWAAWFLAASGTVADGVTLVLPAAMGMLWQRRRLILFALGIPTYLIAIAMTFMASFGFANSNIGDTVTGRGDQTLVRSAIIADIGRARDERSRLGDFIPTSQDAVRIAEVRAKQECARVIGTECRRASDRMAQVQQDADRTQRAAALDAEIKDLNAKFEGLAPVRSADPQVDAVIAVMSWASRGAIALSAADVEGLRLFGLALIMTVFGGVLIAFAKALADRGRA